jgi:preprotein translocase subunit SecG
MLHTLLTIIHILICLVLSAVVLLQSSKGGGLAGAFGGGGGAPQQLLGSRGMTTLLHKLTIWLAVGFFLTSFLLFVTDPSGSPATRGGVVGEAARQGELDVPLQETPVPLPGEAPAQSPGDAPAQTPSDDAADAPAGGGGQDGGQ